MSSHFESPEFHSAPEKNRVSELLERIQDPAMKKHAGEIFERVEEVTNMPPEELSRSSSLQIAGLAVSMPNLMFRMSKANTERGGSGFFTESDVDAFAEFQDLMRAELNRKRKEAQPLLTESALKTFKDSSEISVKLKEWKHLRARLDAKERYLAKIEENPLEERNISEEGIVEFRRLITEYRKQIPEE